MPAYLAEIFNRAIPDPLTDNEPFFTFAGPIDGVTVSDTVTATVYSGSTAVYGTALYAKSVYQ